MHIAVKASDQRTGGDDSQLHKEDRAGNACGRPHEHAVRNRGRNGLCDRGQPARLPHGSARIEGLRYQYGPHRDRHHDRRTDRQTVARPGAERKEDSVLRSQRGRLPVQYVPGSRPHPRSGNALDRRSPWPCRNFPAGLLQVAGSRRLGIAARARRLGKQEGSYQLEQQGRTERSGTLHR